MRWTENDLRLGRLASEGRNFKSDMKTMSALAHLHSIEKTNKQRQ